VENVILSDEIIENCFVCDLNHCNGRCCAGGDRGAPLERGELTILENIYPAVQPFLTPDGIREIETSGPWIEFLAGSWATPVVHERECAYAFYDAAGILCCGIERAFRAGMIDFIKPISCHLYPIRVLHTPVNDCLNYHQWDICASGRALGQKSGIPVFQFLKPALIRKYGDDWFRQLEQEIAKIIPGKTCKNTAFGF
jgi:hypothetical protein